MFVQVNSCITDSKSCTLSVSRSLSFHRSLCPPMLPSHFSSVVNAIQARHVVAKIIANSIYHHKYKSLFGGKSDSVSSHQLIFDYFPTGAHLQVLLLM